MYAHLRAAVTPPRFIYDIRRTISKFKRTTSIIVQKASQLHGSLFLQLYICFKPCLIEQTPATSSIPKLQKRHMTSESDGHSHLYLLE
jgi:hypothetical protein